MTPTLCRSGATNGERLYWLLLFSKTMGRAAEVSSSASFGFTSAKALAAV